MITFDLFLEQSFFQIQFRSKFQAWFIELAFQVLSVDIEQLFLNIFVNEPDIQFKAITRM